MKGKDLLIGLALGFGAGSLVTYILTLGKRAQKEAIEENADKEEKKEEPIIMQNSKKKDFYDYSKIYQTPKTETKKKEEKEQRKDLVGPYVVSPQEYDEHPSYMRTSFRYYSDGVLADDEDEEISMLDAASLIGEDALKHFGEYEDDAVHVINHERGTIYEILLDERRYSDVRASMPRRVEIKRNDETEND